jgi:hypothetical protein
MSVLHQVRDIRKLDGPTFFRLAYRLPAYEGASRTDLEGWLEDVQGAEAQAEQARYEAQFPPRYVDQAELSPEKEGRVSVPVQEASMIQPDRAATLAELAAAGKPEPFLGQIAPIFEMPTVTDD